MTREKTAVLIVVPAYNEAPMIASVVKDIQKTFAQSNYQADIVVVDDGSSDDTAKTAEEAGAHVIKHILNTGSGGATATGLSYANAKSYELAATIDADGQHLAKDVLNGFNLQLQDGADLLIGSRIISPSSEMSLLKKVGNWGLSFITLLFFGVNVTDSQSGMRIFSRKALEKLRWKTSGYEYCSEMLWRAKQVGLRIEEYPIETIYTEYSKTKGQSNWNGVNIVKMLLRQRFVEFFSE